MTKTDEEEDLTAEQCATTICQELSEDIPIGGTDYLVVLDGVKRAMAAEREACATLVENYWRGRTIRDTAEEAVMRAAVSIALGMLIRERLLSE